MFGVSVGIMDGAGGAAGGSYESIASAVGTGSSNTITFSSISSSYKHLQIRGIVFNSTGDYLYLQVNSDTGNNYSQHFLQGTGSSVSAGGSASTSYFRFDNLNSSTAASNGDVFIIDLIDYASTTKNKTMRAFAGIDTNGAGTVTLSSSAWLNTSAINSLTIGTINSNNFSTTTRISLYGIKG